MYEIIIHANKKDSEKTLKEIQNYLSSLDKEPGNLKSFEGEMSFYIYIEASEKTEAERIIQEIKKLKNINDVYLKPHGSTPQ